MKHLRIVLLCCAVLLLRAVSPVAAQELFDITLCFLPAAGGSPGDRDFFDRHLPREIKGAHYVVVDNPNKADLLVSVTLQGSGGNNRSSITLGLIAAANNALALELFWDYADPREMSAWDIGGILAPAGRMALRASDVSKRFDRLRRFTAAQIADLSFTIAIEREEDL